MKKVLRTYVGAAKEGDIALDHVDQRENFNVQ